MKCVKNACLKEDQTRVLGYQESVTEIGPEETTTDQGVATAASYGVV